MDKRGVSPLIATILLVGITVMVSVLIFVFIRTMVEEKISETEIQSNILLACSQNLELEYTDPMPCGVGSDMNVTVWNKSPLDILDFKIQVISNVGSYLKEGGELSSYSKKLYKIESMGFDVDAVNKISFIPVIVLGEINGTCPNIFVEINQLGTC